MSNGKRNPKPAPEPGRATGDQRSGQDPQTEGDLPDSEPGGENHDAGQPVRSSPGGRVREGSNGWDDVEGGAGPRRGDEPAAP